MNQSGTPYNDQFNTPSSWADVLGPVYRKDDLPGSLQEAPDVLTFETRQGTLVCPARQFGVSADGSLEVLPDVSAGWSVVRTVEAQLGNTEKSASLRFLSPFLDGRRSLLDELADPTIPSEDKGHAIDDYVDTAARAGLWVGVEVEDPRHL